MVWNFGGENENENENENEKMMTVKVKVEEIVKVVPMHAASSRHFSMFCGISVESVITQYYVYRVEAIERA